MRVRWFTPLRLAAFASVLAIAAAGASDCGVAKGLAEVREISGSASPTSYPLIARWGDTYGKLHGIGVNLQPAASGDSIRQISAGTIDFAVGAALEPGVARKAGIVQWPLVASGVVPIVNLAGLASGVLRLNGQTLAGIYLGKIRKWNDPAIRLLNPDLALPEVDIRVAHLSTGSAMTRAFTSYLARASAEWRSGPGAGREVQWPIGTGANGNEGVAHYVVETPGAIGYAGYSFANSNELTFALLANQDGKYVDPSNESLTRCVARFGLGNGAALQQPIPGAADAAADSWAVCVVDFVLMPQKAGHPGAAAATLSFFEWAMDYGGVVAAQMHLGVVPRDVAGHVQDLWKEVRSQDGKPIFP